MDGTHLPGRVSVIISPGSTLLNEANERADVCMYLTLNVDSAVPRRLASDWLIIIPFFL